VIIENGLRCVNYVNDMTTRRYRKLGGIHKFGARWALALITVIAAAVAVVTTCSVKTLADPTSSPTLSLDRVPIAAAPPSPSTDPPPAGDSTAWLQSKLDALGPGETLTLAPGTYQHSGVLRLGVAGAQLDGNGATLQATNDATSAVEILADNVTVSNLNLTAPLSGRRYAADEQQRLLVRGNGATVNDVSITGSAAAGVLISGASGFTLDRVTVRNTRADGIHMTNGANDGRVINAVTEATGDDGVAVVSYGTEPQCHDIVIESPRVNGTNYGRGISVVGGQNISYRNIAVSQSYAAGVYIADEGSPWNTASVSDVEVLGGTVSGANVSTNVQNGAVLVYSGNANQGVNGVTVSGLTISDTPASANRNVGIMLDAGSVNGVALNNIALQNTQAAPFEKSPRVPGGGYTTSGWTLNGAPITVQ